MNWLENLLIIAGIGLDIFAAFEVQGAMLASVKKRSLVIACAVVCGLQLIFYFTGYAVCRILDSYGYLANPDKYGQVVAAIVFALLGVRLIAKAIKREFIHESRKDSIKVWDYIKIIITTSLYILAAGCVCGLVGITIWQIIVLILVVSVIMVVGGVYTGIHYGFENKTIAYIGGAVLLWGAGVEILITKILPYV